MNKFIYIGFILISLYLLWYFYRRESFSFSGLLHDAEHDIKNIPNDIGRFFNKSVSSSSNILGGTNHPIIMVPGLGGSILEGQWDFSFSFEYIQCQEKSTTYQQIWPTVYSAIPIENECWYRLMKTSIDSSGEIVSNANVRAKAGLDGIAVLDSVQIGFLNIPLYKYFQPMVDDLRSKGYNQLYGYPYDFRTITNTVAILNFVNGMKSLIEQAYNTSGGQKVNLITHSLGCIVSSYFLNKMSSSWKNKYINLFCPIAPPFGGAAGALESVLTGQTEGIPVTEHFIRGLEREMGGVIFMINNTRVWSGTTSQDQVIEGGVESALIQSGNDRAAKLVGGRLKDMWEVVYSYVNVPVHIFYGSANSTILKLNYPFGYNQTPEITYDQMGDGTVPSRSLTAAVDIFGWKAEQTEISGATHMSILSDVRLFAYF